MIYKHETKHSISAIKEQMTSKAKEYGFGVLKEYNFKDLLQEKGFPIERDITVFELCNPSGAQAILGLHPEVSIFLPCRISIYDNNGQTVISTIGMEDIVHNFNLEETLKSHMTGLFSKLQALINSWE
jgi:uncharacterized protein (DUF302 family)